jgi:hypothetical protein
VKTSSTTALPSLEVALGLLLLLGSVAFFFSFFTDAFFLEVHLGLVFFSELL